MVALKGLFLDAVHVPVAEERKREEKEEKEVNPEKKEEQVNLRNRVAVLLNYLEVREEHEKAGDVDADEPFVKDDKYDIYYLISDTIFFSFIGAFIKLFNNLY